MLAVILAPPIFLLLTLVLVVSFLATLQAKTASVRSRRVQGEHAETLRFVALHLREPLHSALLMLLLLALVGPIFVFAGAELGRVLLVLATIPMSRLLTPERGLKFQNADYRDISRTLLQLGVARWVAAALTFSLTPISPLAGVAWFGLLVYSLGWCGKQLRGPLALPASSAAPRQPQKPRPAKPAQPARPAAAHAAQAARPAPAPTGQQAVAPVPAPVAAQAAPAPAYTIRPVPVRMAQHSRPITAQVVPAGVSTAAAVASASHSAPPAATSATTRMTPPPPPAPPASRTVTLPPGGDALELLCPVCHTPSSLADGDCLECGLVFQSRVPPALHNLPDYDVLRPLGKGGMSSVYLARRRYSNGLVVLKTLASVERSHDPTWRANATQCLRQEADLLRQLDHPHICRMLSWYSSSQVDLLVLEYVPGMTLEQHLTRSDGHGGTLPGGPLPLRDALAHAASVAGVLDYLARLPQPLIHHDIKPANLIVRPHDGQLVLVDFGSAVLPESRTGSVRLDSYGTPGYAAPEQYNGSSSPASDIYGLGSTLYHLLTDDDPCEHPLSFPQLDMLPPAVADTLRPTLERDPAVRPDARRFSAALQRLHTMLPRA